MTTLNPFVITWSILTPTKGKALKKDINAIWKSGIFECGTNGKEIYFHSASKEKALEKIKKIKGLSKQYEIVFITDKQFGNAVVKDGFRVNATKKQLLDRFFI